MKINLITLISATITTGLAVTTSNRAENIVILDSTSVQNLNIQTEAARKRTFEETFFCIGHLGEIPANRSVLSTRTAGRVIELHAHVGDNVKEGQVLAILESRQPGNPPPRVELKAPADGVVVESHLSLGQPVEPEVELLHISDRTKLWAIAHIPQPEVPKIQRGTSARLRIVASRNNESIPVSFHSYVPEADHTNNTIDGIFVIPNTEDELRPGMRTEFHIITSMRDDVLSVPNVAIQGDSAKPVVFVTDFELPNAFIRAPVLVGQKNDQFSEIVSGLFPGDDVVVNGAYSLNHAGSGSGLSLKEALDAAHGHEHNEDGSEMTPAQRAARTAEKTGSSTSNINKNQWITPVVIAVGFLMLAILQGRWNRAQ